MSIATWDAFKPTPDPLAAAKMTPAVMARRARLTRYVKGVLATCAAVCLIALIRVAVSAVTDDDATLPAPAIHKAHASKSLEMNAEEKASRPAAWAYKGGPGRHR